MAELFRLGVSLFLVDRLSSDLRRVASNMRGSSREAEILEQRIGRLQNVVGSQARAGAARSALEADTTPYLARLRILTAEKKRLEQAQESWGKRTGTVAYGGMTPEELGFDEEVVYGQRLNALAQEETALTAIRREKMSAATLAAKEADAAEEKLGNYNKQVAYEEQLLALQNRRDQLSRQETFGLAQKQLLVGMGVGLLGGAAAHMLESQVGQSIPVAAQLAVLGNLAHQTPEQMQDVYRQAAGIAGQTGIFAVPDVLGQMQSMFTSGMPWERVRQLIPLYARAAEAFTVIGKGDPQGAVATLTQMGQLTGIFDPSRASLFSEKVFGAVRASPGSLTSFAAQYSTLLPSLRLAERGKPDDQIINDAIKMTAFVEMMGAKGGFSPNLISTFLSRVGVNTPKAAAAMKAMGLTPGHDAREIISILQEDFKEHPERAAALALIAGGGVRGIRTMAALGQLGDAGLKIWDEITRSVDEAAKDHPIENVQSIIRQSLQGTIAAVETNMKTLQTTIGLIADPALTKGVNALAVAADKLNTAIEKNPVLGKLILAGETGVAGAGILGMGGLAGGALANLAGWEGLGAVLSTTGVYGAAAVGVGTLGYMYNEWLKAHPDAIPGALSLPGDYGGVAIMPDVPKTDVRHGTDRPSSGGTAVHIGEIHIHVRKPGATGDDIANEFVKSLYDAINPMTGVGEGVTRDYAFSFAPGDGL